MYMHFRRILATGLLFVSANLVLVPSTQALTTTEINSIPVFSGTPHERGFAHGQYWQEDVTRLVNTVFDEYLPNILAQYWAYRMAWRMEAHIPQHLIEEMQGLAEGAELDYADVLVGNLIQDLLQLSGFEAACSAYLVMPSRSTNEGMLYGRNLDWYHDMAPVLRQLLRPMIFVEDSGRKTLSIGLPGMVGVLTGINNKGVAMSLMYSYHDDYTADGFPSTLLFRHTLASSDTFDEALSNFKNTVPRTIPINILLADGQKAAVLESTANQLAVRTAERGLLYSANHFESTDLIGDAEPGRDYRWPLLTQHNGSNSLFDFEKVRSVVADAAMEDSAFTNVLAFFVDYNNQTVRWGAGGPPAADGPIAVIPFSEAGISTAASEQ